MFIGTFLVSYMIKDCYTHGFDWLQSPACDGYHAKYFQKIYKNTASTYSSKGVILFFNIYHATELYFKESLPIRVKAIHYYNYPKVFDVVFAMEKIFHSEKIRKRVSFSFNDKFE
jgi:hypothetical protein